MAQVDSLHLDQEGFICPACMKELTSASALTKHFETAHSAGSTDDDVLGQVKGLKSNLNLLWVIEQSIGQRRDTMLSR